MTNGSGNRKKNPAVLEKGGHPHKLVGKSRRAKIIEGRVGGRTRQKDQSCLGEIREDDI